MGDGVEVTFNTASYHLHLFIKRAQIHIERVPPRKETQHLVG